MVPSKGESRLKEETQVIPHPSVLRNVLEALQRSHKLEARVVVAQSLSRA